MTRTFVIARKHLKTTRTILRWLNEHLKCHEMIHGGFEDNFDYDEGSHGAERKSDWIGEGNEFNLVENRNRKESLKIWKRRESAIKNTLSTVRAFCFYSL
jgi:hypothetical protein